MHNTLHIKYYSVSTLGMKFTVQLNKVVRNVTKTVSGKGTAM